MGTVREILARKGADVLSIRKDASVLEAALLMNEHRVGSLVVLEDGHVAGIFTERDLLRRVVCERLDPFSTMVADVMTEEVFCATPDTPLAEVRGTMKNRRIRHLPVVDSASGLIGLVSIGDLNAHEATTQEQTIHLMQEYLYGRV
jgi:CBS domain-containing protein